MTQLATRLRGRTAGITYWHSSPNADRSLEKAESDLLKARLTERDFAIRDGHLRRAGSEHQGLVRLFFPIGVRGRELRDRDHCCSAAYGLGLVFRMRPRLALGEETSPHLYTITRLGFDVLRKARWGRAEERERVRYSPLAAPDFSRFVHDVDINDFCTT